ncbi:MAG TPA: hypothetical protein VM580_29940 [Labilithrix sp.]|nr:hypothetical protein [Labilithrix sp.]
MLKTRALIFCSLLIGSLVVAACAEDDPNSLIGSRSGDGDEKGQPGDEKGESDEEIVDVEVPNADEDDVQEGAEETAGGNALAPGESPPTVLYLNPRGARLSFGRNDSRANTSQIVRQGAPTNFPPSRFANDSARWATIMNTVRNHFARYNVTVVDTEPTTGTYLEAVVTSGSPALIGYGNNLGGIAPSGCGVIRSSVVLVFDGRLRSDVHTAEVISHELGHSLSLSHTQTPTDLMSYTNRTPLRFEDVPAACGPSPQQPQRCNCGGPTQNNHRQLLMQLGPARSNNPPPNNPPPNNPPPNNPPPNNPPTNPAQGTLTVLSPANGSTYTPNRPVEIRIDARRAGAVRRVDLRWTIGSRTYAYACPGSCSISPDGIYTWRIVPGGGDRSFSARATRADGQVIDSPVVRITSRR